jgi:hypothetical protein
MENKLPGHTSESWKQTKRAFKFAGSLNRKNSYGDAQGGRLSLALL